MVLFISGYVKLFTFGRMVSRIDRNDVYADFAKPGGWNGMNFTDDSFIFILLSPFLTILKINRS